MRHSASRNRTVSGHPGASEERCQRLEPCRLVACQVDSRLTFVSDSILRDLSNVKAADDFGGPIGQTFHASLAGFDHESPVDGSEVASSPSLLERDSSLAKVACGERVPAIGHVVLDPCDGDVLACARNKPVVGATQRYGRGDLHVLQPIEFLDRADFSACLFAPRDFLPFGGLSFFPVHGAIGRAVIPSDIATAACNSAQRNMIAAHGPPTCFSATLASARAVAISPAFTAAASAFFTRAIASSRFSLESESRLLMKAL